VKTPGFWAKKSTLSNLLFPLTPLYHLATSIRPLLVKPTKVAVPVICVGNLTAGGAGKTPTVACLVSLLKSTGHEPHILSRGYGGSLRGPVLVDQSKHSAAEAGDEPLLLCRCAPVWVGADRRGSAKLAIDAGATVLVMDDGFQNSHLHKDLSILVVDGAYGFGNGRLLPAGPLREGLPQGLSRSDAVLLIGNDQMGVENLLEGKPMFRSSISVDSEIATWMKDKAVFGFAGIGLPEKFRRTLEGVGADVVGFEGFEDHHVYSLAEIEQLALQAEEQGATLVTTEKDWVKLPAKWQAEIRSVPIELCPEDKAGLTSFLVEGLKPTTLGQSAC
jgi:tetraacyldisaccharide 4'-kinase